MDTANPKAQTNNRGKKLIIIALCLLVIFGALLFEPLRDLTWRVTEFVLDKDGARKAILAYPYSIAYYTVLCAVQVVVAPIPGEVTGLLGGYIFGWARGFVYATLGLTIGSAINVLIGRFFERVFLEKVIPTGLLDSFEAKSKRWGLATVFLLFLFPGAPKDTLCYLFGLTRLPVLSFLVVSSLARMPGTLVLCLQGDKAFEGEWTFFIILTLISMVIIIPMVIYKDRIFTRLGLGLK